MVMSTTGVNGVRVASDPEVLAGIFVVGGILAVVSFIAFRIVISIGEEVETPVALQSLLPRPFERERAA